MSSSSRILLNAVGDISLGDYNMTIGFGVSNVIKKRSPHFLFERTMPILRKGDIVFGNLEGVLSNAGSINSNIDSLVMRGSPESISGLTYAGFNILNVANNHMMQHGIVAFRETCTLLVENGIRPLGLKGDSSYSSQPVITSVKGKRLGFLGYAFEHDKYAKDLGYAFGKRDEVVHDICLLRSEVDILIVSCHWGLELIKRPSIYIADFARELIDHGVDVILGHHPHVIQGIEKYNEKLITYSLGNFIFDLANSECNRSMILQIDINDDRLDYKIVPLNINSYYQPYPLCGAEKKERIDEIRELSSKIPHNSGELTDEMIANYYWEYFRLVRLDKLSTLCKFLMNLHRIKPSILVKIVSAKIIFRVKKILAKS